MSIVTFDMDYINRLVVLDVNFAIITDDITVPFGGEVMRNAYTLRVKYTASTTGQVLVTMESFPRKQNLLPGIKICHRGRWVRFLLVDGKILWFYKSCFR